MQDVARKPPRKAPFLSPQFVRAMLAGHSALGIAFAALIYIVCLTGTLTVFMHELKRWEQPDAPVVEGSLSADVATKAVEEAYRKALALNAAHDIFVMGPTSTQQRLLANFHDHGTGIEGHWIGDGTGNLVVEQHAPWAEFITDLHIRLHLPHTWGLFLVGLTGVALLSSLVSGLLSHPRLFKDAFALRWGGSRRLQEADLHNRLGVWGLPFHVVVSTTGALLGLSTLIVGVLALAAYEGDSERAFASILGPMPTKDETAAPLPDVAAMIRDVQAKHGDAEFVSVFIQHIGKAGQVVNLGMKTPGHLAMSNAYYFDGNGKSLGDGGLETGSIGQQILGALQPLHFGWFGGLPVKIAYGLLGLALTIVTQTGITIWLARRRDAGRAAPHWEKVWAAVTWGQPLAFVVAALAIFAGGGSYAVPAYLATTVVSLLAAPVTPDAAVMSRVLRLLAGLLGLSAVIVHGFVWSGRISDPAALWVSGVMAVIALALLASALRPNRARLEALSRGG
ncbi:PepSY-associated TM helix domain-containing protein [Hyphomicrobium sp.]|uniref:PepSY-associated TM helix domain-containing protein n=1 Tax=Hyphomicrobium sp. TaxID=82 RepID=UPI0025B9CA61|nr:PepSY-associated TM helix domain-containing protein [Hyphomicrobium sp.]MCC7254001.1 PepSY domain-containing protein [Hyphomicrobium sp.]